MERRPPAFRYLLAIPLLILLGAGLLVISSGSDGSGAVARGAGPAATESAGPGTHATVRPVVEVDVARALEAEGVGEAMAECAGKRVGAAASPGQLSRARRQPSYAWRWAWKAAGHCRRAFLTESGPYA